MELIANRSRTNPSIPSIYPMNTYFVDKLIQFGYNSVRSWTKRLKPDLFNYDKILIPKHSTKHWRLAIVHLNEKVIEHYDSNGSCWSGHLTLSLQLRRIGVSGQKENSPQHERLENEVNHIPETNQRNRLRCLRLRVCGSGINKHAGQIQTNRHSAIQTKTHVRVDGRPTPHPAPGQRWSLPPPCHQHSIRYHRTIK